MPTLADLPRIIPLMDTLEVLEGDSFQQSCIAQSSPPPLLRWQKDGSLVMDSSVSVSSPTPSMAIIIIPRVSQTHSGTYTCSASNRAGRVDESIVLTVNGTAFVCLFLWNFLYFITLYGLFF